MQNRLRDGTPSFNSTRKIPLRTLQNAHIAFICLYLQLVYNHFCTFFTFFHITNGLIACEMSHFMTYVMLRFDGEQIENRQVKLSRPKN